MANYKVYIKASAKKELENLPQNDLSKIVEKIKSLSITPRPAGYEKLSAEDKYRIRFRNYRIVYSIEDEKLIFSVVKIGHRKDTYKKR